MPDKSFETKQKTEALHQKSDFIKYKAKEYLAFMSCAPNETIEKPICRGLNNQPTAHRVRLGHKMWFRRVDLLPWWLLARSKNADFPNIVHHREQSLLYIQLGF